MIDSLANRLTQWLVSQPSLRDYLRQRQGKKPDFGKWQPIETAPRDGTWVLLTGGEDTENYGENGPVVSARWWQEYGPDGDWYWAYAYWDSAWRSEYKNPTHWMPPPDPPA